MCYHPHPKNDVRCFLCLLSNDSVKGRGEKGGFLGNIHQKKCACSADIGQNVRKGVLAEAGTSLFHGNKATRHTPPPSGKTFRLFRPMLHGELLGKTNSLRGSFQPRAHFLRRRQFPRIFGRVAIESDMGYTPDRK